MPNDQRQKTLSLIVPLPKPYTVKARVESQLSPATKDTGHGRSNTVPRQSTLKISETVMQESSDAHHAQSSSSAQLVHCEYSLHLGLSTGHKTCKRCVGRVERDGEGIFL